ncbi:hypothetical protein ACPW7J_08050 [Ihubacter sp. rT4E-8]|uniref:hypothetical protein n=1 Tax=Ihubacter sp. rT4E-8 TaxID=3242369 RepID=UPI001379F467
MYEEVEKPRGGKVMSILIGNSEYSTDIRDIQKMINVDKGLQELIDFYRKEHIDELMRK